MLSQTAASAVYGARKANLRARIDRQSYVRRVAINNLKGQEMPHIVLRILQYSVGSETRPH